LHERHIHTLKSRSLENIPARIAERSRSREGKRRSVEPPVRGLIRQLRISHEVRTIVGAEAEDRSAGAAVVDIRKQRHGEWPAGLQADDAECFPAVDELACETFGVFERQRVRVTD